MLLALGKDVQNNHILGFLSAKQKNIYIFILFKICNHKQCKGIYRDAFTNVFIVYFRQHMEVCHKIWEF